MTVILVSPRLKFRGLNSERSAFSPGGAKQIGAEYYCTDTKIYYAWDGTQWVIPVPQSGGGMEQHGNEWHNPDFAEVGAGGGGGNLDGGLPDTNYGGISPIDGGIP